MRSNQRQSRRVIPLVVALALLIVTAGIGTATARERGKPSSPSHAGGGHQPGVGPSAGDFVDIRQVQPNVKPPAGGAAASTGLFVSRCGTNRNGHRNSDNYIVGPGVVNAAHHVHDYVGNLSTDANSTDDSLAAAGTTCRFNDKSVYFWPVLRLQNRNGADADADGGGRDGNIGRILTPNSVRLEFRGNAQAKVIEMPRFLRMITGDAKAATNGGANARAQWTCTGFEDRTTTKYPRCPAGSQVRRILDFPGCWDGTNLDSTNHRTHVAFADAATGACPAGTKPIPQLRMTLSYQIEPGAMFAVDAFPEQLHSPVTDHADFENLMPRWLRLVAMNCINVGRRC